MEAYCNFTDQGDARAFEQLVVRHGPMVLGVCRRMLRDSHAADDAFQATFLVLVRKATSLRQPDSWETGCTVWPTESLPEPGYKRCGEPIMNCDFQPCQKPITRRMWNSENCRRCWTKN